MASYPGNDVNEPGQYPTTAFHLFGLPEQNFGSGAPGGSAQSSKQDQGNTNEPGQYPAKETFTGVALDGTGAPGTSGVPYDGVGSGPDAVAYSKPTFYKGQREPSVTYSQDNGTGYVQEHVKASLSGTADWTQANSHSYGDGYDMPGVAGNTPSPGSGQHQTDGQDGSGHVMYGGWLKGHRPSTSSHVAGSGPGT
jgi:hypothetical protein